MKLKRSRGFTLVEVMMAVVISVLIFSALGSLLNRCFSLWLGSQAQWKLAQHAKITRTRILYGGFGVGTGLLNATNASVVASGDDRDVVFNLPTDSDIYHIAGVADSGSHNIILERNGGGGANSRYAHSVKQVGVSDTPVVFEDDFSAVISNSIVTLSYTLNLSILGKDFELPQVVEAKLIND